MEVLKGKKEMDIFDKGVKYAHSYWGNKIGKKIEEYKNMIKERPEHKAIIEIHINELQELLEEEN